MSLLCANSPHDAAPYYNFNSHFDTHANTNLNFNSHFNTRADTNLNAYPHLHPNVYIDFYADLDSDANRHAGTYCPSRPLLACLSACR